MKRFQVLGLFLFVLASGCKTTRPGTTETSAPPQGHDLLAYLAIGGVT